MHILQGHVDAVIGDGVDEVVVAVVATPAVGRKVVPYLVAANGGPSVVLDEMNLVGIS